MVIAANPRDRRRSPPEGTDRLPRFFVHVYRLVAQVPKGKVVTYGQVAALLGAPRAARAVGTALRYLPRSLTRTVPWQRVLNAAGGISLRGDVLRAEEQRWLLEGEGIEFNRHGVMPGLARYHFHPRCFAAWEFERTKVEGTGQSHPSLDSRV